MKDQSIGNHAISRTFPLLLIAALSLGMAHPPSAPALEPRASRPVDPPPNPEQLMVQAKAAFEKGLYAKAIALAQKAVKGRPYDAWQLIGRAACMLNDRRLIKQALWRLDPPRQNMVQYACWNNGVELPF